MKQNVLYAKQIIFSKQRASLEPKMTRHGASRQIKQPVYGFMLAQSLGWYERGDY